MRAVETTSSSLCSSSVQRSNRFEVGTIRERSDAFLLFSLSSFYSFRKPLPFSIPTISFIASQRWIYIYVYTPFDNSLADDTTRQVPRSATDQYAFTIAAWNDNYCYTRDNSRRCPSVGIRVYCARRPSGERDLQSERERKRKQIT